MAKIPKLCRTDLGYGVGLNRHYVGIAGPDWRRSSVRRPRAILLSPRFSFHMNCAGPMAGCCKRYKIAILLCFERIGIRRFGGFFFLHSVACRQSLGKGGHMIEAKHKAISLATASTRSGPGCSMPSESECNCVSLQRTRLFARCRETS